jgi:TP901 family phage tail tape measure protein
MASSSRLQLILDLRDRITGRLNAVRDNIDRNVGGMRRALDGLSAGIPGIGGALSMIANPYTAAAAAVTALGAAYVKCSKMAVEWHNQMAEINVTAELSRKELGKLSDELMEIGSRNVMPLEQIPKAFNRIISAGLDVNTSLEMLEPTMRAAKAGFTDIETVAGAAVSVMMSSGESAVKVYDVLFETVKEGNASFRDLAGYLPKVVPLARNVGFALDETAGAFASLTTKLSAEQSTTSLQGIMRSLSSPEVVEKLGKIGVEVFDRATGMARPLLEIVKDMEKQMNGLSDVQRSVKFDSMGFDRMSTLGFATLIQDVGGLQKAIDATRNSQGALNKAYDDAKAPMDSWKIIANQIKVAMTKIGETSLPMIEAVGQKILKFIEQMKELWNESALLRDAVHALGVTFEWTFKIATLPIRMVINLYAALYRAVAKLSIVSGFGDAVENVYLKIKPYLLWIWQIIEQIGNVLYKIATFDFVEVAKSLSNFKIKGIDELKREVVIKASPTVNVDDIKLGEDIPQALTTVPVPVKPATVPADGASADATSVQGAASKNLYINIGSFFKDTYVNNSENNGLTWDEVERRLTEKFMGVVRSVETMGL